jgi:hypothetical protein
VLELSGVVGSSLVDDTRSIRTRIRIMVDRTDIDALLIGALYGELTPADEARLTAHLESHPADRTALDNLTRTRAAVRDSRILTFQAEPSQAISALLLQEASRRAPRRVDASETASWFQRFVRSFVAHPAMAAAATLVLVIAATGTFFLRGTDQFADSAQPPSAVERAPAPAVPPIAVPAGEPEEAAGAGAAGSAATADPGATGDSMGRLSGPSPGAAAGASADPSQLDAPPVAKGSLEPTDGRDESRPRAKADVDELRKLRAAPPRASKPEPMHGIELRTPQLSPKDYKDSEKPSANQRRRQSEDSDDDRFSSGPRASASNSRAGEASRDSRNAVVSGGAAAAAPVIPPPPPAAAPPAAASRGAGPSGGSENELRELSQAPAQSPAPAQGQAGPANDAKRAPAKPVTQLPSSSVNNAGSGQADRRFDKAQNAANNANASTDARQAQLLDWARKQRDQVISLVNANRCQEAASAAIEIYNRAPEYFSASVATDRQIKPCLAYVNERRERAERNRATKNAADQAPAQAAPTRK